MFHESELIVHD